MTSDSDVPSVADRFGRGTRIGLAVHCWRAVDDPPFLRSGGLRPPLPQKNVGEKSRSLRSRELRSWGNEMTLPVFQFWDRLGESVNLSTLDDRATISKAELYHVVDVGTGTWCRPCRSTGCTHATQIEEILATAGLGRSQVDYDDLPGIANVTRYNAPKELVVTSWFDNGGRVRYHEQRDGTVVQSVYTPENDREPAEVTEQPDATSAPAALVALLAEYCHYRQRGDLNGLRQQYPEVARVVGEPPVVHADD
ncbi:hypothetical protein [Halocatena salina]|uniref:Uncharacterized protein n=1 Tax=Halocatena salina TaxID=2934340 RepID=A0A8U0A7D6_9EURY|nr:hypothetical protein [Halocatena salina]UPM43913.1 hypothetical protein MW046_05580 [Halocatena salina]